MTRRRPSAARLCSVVATVVLAAAAVVGLPAVTWATEPGSQCEVALAGTDTAAVPTGCEPAPDTSVGDDPEPTVAPTRAPTNAEEPTLVDEDDSSEPEATHDEPEPAPEAELPAVSGLSLNATAAPNVVGPGDPVTFSVTVSNAGPADDPAVTVLGVLPAGAVVRGDVSGLDASSGSISFGAMAVGASKTVDIVVQMPPSSGEVVTTPQVAGQHSEALNVEHLDTVVVAVVPFSELPAGDEATVGVPPYPSHGETTDTVPPTSEAGAAGSDERGDQPDNHPAESPTKSPGGQSGGDRGGDHGSPGPALANGSTVHSTRSSDEQRRLPVVGGHDSASGEPTTEPLDLRSTPSTQTTLAAATVAMVGRVSTAPLEVLGVALLAAGAVLLGISGGRSARSRRR